MLLPNGSPSTGFSSENRVCIVRSREAGAAPVGTNAAAATRAGATTAFPFAPVTATAGAAPPPPALVGAAAAAAGTAAESCAHATAAPAITTQHAKQIRKALVISHPSSTSPSAQAHR